MEMAFRRRERKPGHLPRNPYLPATVPSILFAFSPHLGSAFSPLKGTFEKLPMSDASALICWLAGNLAAG